ncbi:hypothetical protein E3_0510 [Rhodococcus phage E3]|uniref:hypothetical protein n=1 Tax=Rhodococcus phage E3 TaxID=1007869 RepID=UPI0002C6D54D|nr:hypothetical protein M176_gp055 [Rhodococcus phage E3]AEQ20965.1 hypothetical protein E3_0510 [Rhodococcus phage E3]
MSALAEVLEKHVPTEAKLIANQYWRRYCRCGAMFGWLHPGQGPTMWAKHVEDEYEKALLARHLDKQGSNDG